ncbi:MAG TPA: hypothetical protein QKA14_01340 [Candidatus Megaira endosymbiont of Hartmannula sinica]|nr:hypothetical protein [Candidatus Megaera endosymbiont of Hartmannula sinica]
MKKNNYLKKAVIYSLLISTCNIPSIHQALGANARLTDSLSPLLLGTTNPILSTGAGLDKYEGDDNIPFTNNSTLKIQQLTAIGFITNADIDNANIAAIDMNQNPVGSFSRAATLTLNIQADTSLGPVINKKGNENSLLTTNIEVGKTITLTGDPVNQALDDIDNMETEYGFTATDGSDTVALGRLIIGEL